MFSVSGLLGVDSASDFFRDSGEPSLLPPLAVLYLDF